MTTSELMKAMSNAGAPFEAIIIAIQALEAKDAELAAREAELAQKRAGNAERQQRFRERRNERKESGSPRRVTRNVTRNVTHNVTPPIDNIHTPSPDISSDEESQSQRDEPAAVLESWNEMAKPIGLPTARQFTGNRLKTCKARLREHGLEAIQAAIRRIPQSAFLRGDAGNWNGANLTFFFRPDTVTKILEGEYDDRSNRNNAGSHQAYAGRPKDGAIAACDRRLGLDGGFGERPRHDHSAGPADRGRALAPARTLF